MNTTISERIKICYKQSGAKSVRSYAMSLGMPERTISDVINKGVEPRTPFITTFLAKNPQLSAEWLMKGEEPMFKDEKLPSQDVTAQNSIVGDGNNNNHIENSDDSFWKDLVKDLRETVSYLRSRCSTYEQQNQELQRLLEEEKKRNFYCTMMVDNK